ncbi:ABC transporter ATP-binding protein [Pseudomonas sp. MWU16-30317]|uniref:ABC transporter ATP-binding protein n=1 Tax=Pseudomonas sp. MWU16-30317 TaxID=2878095 RepID=UPI001CF9F4D0|nr:ABC transporter ATP-binding protein [Pseudomonas sp. MWU16-30317]
MTTLASTPLLDVRNLRVEFGKPSTPLIAVNDLSLQVQAGETLAIVGESGCGKSVTALALTRLLHGSQARLSGSVRYRGESLSDLDERAMRAIRGRHIGMIFQDPMSALNPVMSIGDQLIEAIQAHHPLPRAQARARAVELLERVRIPEPHKRLDDYPHRFSGGMRQRVVIAMALAGGPSLLIADEPTTALDVTIQAQILHLLASLQREMGMGLILITHDLGVVAETADRVMVMYAGRKVEEQPVHGLFAHPRHPYTRGLIGARPALQLEAIGPGKRRVRLKEIPGMVPMLSQLPVGCAFAARCEHADVRCQQLPELLPFEPLAAVACHHPCPAPQRLHRAMA